MIERNKNFHIERYITTLGFYLSLHQLSYFGTLSNFSKTDGYIRRANLDSKKPIYVQDDAVTYEKRPNRHCLCCWQSKSKNSTYNHEICKEKIRQYLNDTLAAAIPIPNVITVIENNK